MIEIRHPGIKNIESSLCAYNEIFLEKGILHRDSFYLYLIKLLKPKSGKLLLDVACGEGRLVVLARNLNLKAVGVDFAYNGLKIGYEQAPQAGWTACDGEKIPFKTASVDYVTSIGSLEHYLHPEDGVREIARVLKPEGKACILLPNTFGLLGNITYVSKKGEVFDDGQPIQRYATRLTWENMLVSNGLLPIKTIGYGDVVFPKTLGDLSWILSHPIKIFRLLINIMIPKNLSNHFIFICTLGK